MAQHAKSLQEQLASESRQHTLALQDERATYEPQIAKLQGELEAAVLLLKRMPNQNRPVVIHPGLLLDVTDFLKARKK